MWYTVARWEGEKIEWVLRPVAIKPIIKSRHRPESGASPTPNVPSVRLMGGGKPLHRRRRNISQYSREKAPLAQIRPFPFRASSIGGGIHIVTKPISYGSCSLGELCVGDCALRAHQWCGAFKSYLKPGERTRIIRIDPRQLYIGEWYALSTRRYSYPRKT